MSSLRYVFKSLIDLEPWHYDPEVTPLPWREEEEIREGAPLSFGFTAFDGIVMPHPPIQRGLDMVTKALRASGHELVPWKPPSHSLAISIHVSVSLCIFSNLTFLG